MGLKTFHLEVRSASWAKPALKTLDVDDQIYTILGSHKGRTKSWAINGSTPDSYFAKLLVEDADGNQYLIRTDDNCPMPIAKGSQDEMIGAQYQTWNPGKRLYVGRLRTYLLEADAVYWDADKKCYYIVE